MCFFGFLGFLVFWMNRSDFKSARNGLSAYENPILVPTPNNFAEFLRFLDPKSTSTSMTFANVESPGRLNKGGARGKFEFWPLRVWSVDLGLELTKIGFLAGFCSG
jgi:hypothetical protein